MTGHETEYGETRLFRRRVARPVPAGNQPIPAHHPRGRSHPRPADQAGERGGARQARALEPPLRGVGREEVPESGRRALRPDQRGQPRADPRRPQVRRDEGDQVHLLRGVVDPPGDPPGARRAVAHRARPARFSGTLHRIGKRSASLLQELGREPTVEEIAEGMDISQEEVAKTLSISQAHLSLDAPLTPGEDNKLLDYLPDTTNPGPDDEIFEHALTESIESVLATLKEREARILRLYFGLEGQEPMTLEEIGSLLGITRERVRQIKEKASSEPISSSVIGS